MSGPTDPKRRAGNAGGRPVAIPRRVHAIPETPPELGKAGATAWVRLWTAGDWLNPRVHLEPMRMLAALYDEADQYRRALRRSVTVRGSQGQPRLHPAAMAMRATEASIRRWMKELGFFDKRAEPAADDDATDAFLFGAEPKSPG